MIFGAGTAGIGIAEQIRDAIVRDGVKEEEPYDRFWCIDKTGLLTDDSPDIQPFQKPYARRSDEVKDYARNGSKAFH